MKKTLWFILAIVAFGACNKEDENLLYEFHYSNDTAYPAKIIVYGNDITMTSSRTSDTITVAAHQDMPSVISSICVGEYCTGNDKEPFRGLADSARIVFSQSKELFFTPASNCNTNVLCLKAYSQTREGDRLILEYTLSNEIYNQATDIK